MCMGVYMIVTVFFAVPANYLNDKYGIHVGVSKLLLINTVID